MVWVSPRKVRVQSTSSSPKSPGTTTVNTPRWRRGRKTVGWPRSGPPGAMRLSAPTGMWTISSELRLKYPHDTLMVPSGLGYQPS